MADLFDTINNWLLTQALSEDSFAVTLKGLANRLLDGGVPVARISVGRSILHPVIGLIGLKWGRDSGQVNVEHVPRNNVAATIPKAPFADLAEGKCDFIEADLTDPAQVARYSIFDDLAQKGITGYFALNRRFGTSEVSFAGSPIRFRGATISFATKRFSGFSASDLEGLKRVVTPLSICARIDNDRFVASEILETYLGRISGSQVLTGQIERGDGRQIDCAIFYSDLRGSLDLSQTLETQTYLDTVNAYFDCTATAVAEHGGEVLKFIGDGVLAIFPFDDATRPRANMCAAALAGAREAFARATHTNKARNKEGLPDISFGVALHVGSVIYGNVGTAKRLDFTATGPAVGLAARVEQLTRSVDTPLLATADFAAHVQEAGTALPPQKLRGFQDDLSLVSYPHDR